MSHLVRLEGKHSTQNAHCALVWGKQKRECNRVHRLVWALNSTLFLGAVSLYFVIWVSLDNNSGSLKLLKLNCDWSTDSRRRNSSERGVALRLVKNFRRSWVICFGSVKPVHHSTLGVPWVVTYIVIAAFFIMFVLNNNICFSLFLFQHQNGLCKKPTVLECWWAAHGERRHWGL